jgi:hypothetical protein
MNGGPFRDTLTPLIEEAKRQLADLRQRRAALEVRYEDARKRLDAKAVLPPDDPLRVQRPMSEIDGPPIVWPHPSALRKPIIAGVIVGLITWPRIFGQHH